MKLDSDLTWRFADEAGVHQVPTGDLLEEVLQAEEEGAVAKPGHRRLRHELQVHVAGQDGQVGEGGAGVRVVGAAKTRVKFEFGGFLNWIAILTPRKTQTFLRGRP